MKIGSKRTMISVTLAMLLSGAMPALAEKTSSDTPEWDVSKPQGEVKTVKIDTTESTWSNVDVSPNGKTIILTYWVTSTPCQFPAVKRNHW